MQVHSLYIGLHACLHFHRRGCLLRTYHTCFRLYFVFLLHVWCCVGGYWWFNPTECAIVVWRFRFVRDWASTRCISFFVFSQANPNTFAGWMADPLGSLSKIDDFDYANSDFAPVSSDMHGVVLDWERRALQDAKPGLWVWCCFSRLREYARVCLAMRICACAI